jgi:hypothetical protein
VAVPAESPVNVQRMPRFQGDLGFAHRFRSRRMRLSVASLRESPPFAYNYRNHAAGTGNAVTDLIFSIAKRDVTFFSGTALISFL